MPSGLRPPSWTSQATLPFAALAAARPIQGSYRLRGHEPDLSGVRIHLGADAVCQAFGARALTTGTDIYFRSDSFAPWSPAGLWLLAHEVAHVVQQQRGLTGAPPGSGWTVAPPNGPGEHEADAAARAVLAGRRYDFGHGQPSRSRQLAGSRQQLVVQRFMAWEHLLLGNLDPDGVLAAVGVAAAGRDDRQAGTPLGRQHALLAELGRHPHSADEKLLAAQFPGVTVVRLSASGLLVTAGELNVLADYISDPADVDSAAEAFIGPLVQAVRLQSARQLRALRGGRIGHRMSGSHPGGSHPPWDKLRYPAARTFAEIRELTEIDALGRRCQLPPWKLYSSVLSRNAAHFAPHSWYRWRSLHLLARDLIRQAGDSPARRDQLRSYAQVVAGFADHYLQDSFAAGHLINKTLVMQWYIEWLLQSRLPVADRDRLAAMTVRQQPYLHGPDLYDPVDEARVPSPGSSGPPGADPESAMAAGSAAERELASGVTGSTPAARQEAYEDYLTMLRSSTVQYATRVVHDYLNIRPLIVASHADGPRYQIRGDRTMLDDDAGAIAAASAATASRRAISDLLDHGHTAITSSQILAMVPRLVVADGALMPLSDWHDGALKQLCMTRLFARTRVPGMLIRLRPHLGMPAPGD
jgi:Domain of unknown function (DUF4157)